MNSYKTAYIIAALVLFYSCTWSFESRAASLTASASAHIMQATTVIESTSLSFGTINPDNAGDIVSIDTANVVSAINGSSVLPGTSVVGSFTSIGEPNAAISISFSNGVITGTGQEMNINNFVHNAGATPMFNAVGVLIFNVGGDLSINSSQEPGLYAGTYTVSIDYP